MKYNVLTKEILLRSLGKSDAVTAVLPDEVIDYLCAAFEDPNTNDDVHELRDVVAPHLIDVSLLSAADAAVLDWLRGVVRQLVDAGVLENRVAGAGAGAQLLDAPVDIASTMDDADERNLFIDKEDRLGLVDQEQLKEKSEKYLKRKAERQAKQDRLDEKKKAASLEALRSIQEEQQKSAKFVRSGITGGSRDIKLENFSLHAGKETLVANASVTLAFGRRYGLVGRNGIGKSTLLRSMSARELNIPANLSILHVFQEAQGTDEPAIDAVLSCDVERTELLAEVNQLESEQAAAPVATASAPLSAIVAEEVAGRTRRIAAIYSRLDAIDAHTAEARARAILFGLGFDEAMQAQPTEAFSGGWRMRIALARALFARPDLLLLDEPTNHLDLYAVLWLEQYLLTWPATLVVVSHSRDFLNAIATDIIHIYQQQIYQYKGCYDDYESARAERLRQLSRQTEAAEKQRKHVQRFIDRFRYNAKRASMVQSRIKQLNKMQVLPEIHEDPLIQFGFNEPAVLPPPLLQFQDVSFTYPGSNSPILTKVNLNIDMDSRVALVGPNGAGKSTLLKLLAGELDATSGFVHRNAKLKFAVFSQHFVDQLDLSRSAVEHMCAKYATEQLKPQEARAALGRFGVVGDLAIRSMATLSGGQKSRVVLATIAFSTPSMLLLDEPSNHLDLDSVEALSLALTEFTGGVLLVSHDEHLISLVCDEIWVLGDQTVTRWDDTFAAYKKNLLKNVLFNNKGFQE